MAGDEIFTAPVQRIAAGGTGIAFVQGKIVFIPMTAPGDLIRGRITEDHRTWARGEVLEIAESSPDRRVPVCPHYGICGGCSLQHLSYKAQVKEKAAIVREAFRRIGGFSLLPELRVHESPAFEYRNRIRLHRGAPGPELSPESGVSPGSAISPGLRSPQALGFKGRRSGGIVPIGDCPVADPGLRSLLRSHARGEEVFPGREGPPRGSLSLYSRGDTLLREGPESRGKVKIRGRELALDAGLFFQSNGTLLETLIGDLMAAAGEADPSLPAADIYCGVGTFGAFLADRFSRIDLVEENKTALDLARENVRGGKHRFFALRDDQWVRGEGHPGKKPAPRGFAVADPPRQGLPRILRQWLCQGGPPIFAYVSCDPATLARDCGELRTGGYGISSLDFYDFYPQTAHAEVLAVLRRESE
jgi:23S rRNA (uracil1939-C5)-methyltransferase